MNPFAPARFSLVLAQAFPGLPDEEVSGVIQRAAAAHGFDHVELVPATDERDARAVRDTLERHQLGSVFLAGLPLLRAGASLSAQGDGRRAAIDIVTGVIAEASAAGASAVLVTSGHEDRSRDREEALDRLVDSLTELARVSEDHGVRIRLEPTDTDLEHRQLVGSTVLALQVVDRVAANNGTIDLNLDLSHLLQLGEDPNTALRLAGGHCRHFHLANTVLDPGNPLRGDRHPPFGHPASLVGLPELQMAIKVLRELGYADQDAVVGVEVTPLPGADAWLTLRGAVDAVRAAA